MTAKLALRGTQFEKEKEKKNGLPKKGQVLSCLQATALAFFCCVTSSHRLAAKASGDGARPALVTSPSQGQFICNLNGGCQTPLAVNRRNIGQQRPRGILELCHPPRLSVPATSAAVTERLCLAPTLGLRNRVLQAGPRQH